jgi:hypothetical protein
VQQFVRYLLDIEEEMSLPEFVTGMTESAMSKPDEGWEGTTRVWQEK